MTYERHVTMIIQFAASYANIFAMILLGETCLTLTIYLAKTIPPTDMYSTLFNVWFGLLATCCMLYILEAIKGMCKPPPALISLLDTGKHTTLVRITNEKTSMLAIPTVGKSAFNLTAYLIDAWCAPHTVSKQTSVPERNDPVQPDTSSAPDTKTASPTCHSESVGDTRSQADTEVFPDCIGQIKPTTV